LPEQMNHVIGRDEYVADAKLHLSQTRLLTLKGPGGAGKTTIAIELARKCFDEFTDGVWLVPLGTLSDPKSIQSPLAAVLGLKEHHGTTILTVIKQSIGEKRILLILDNCEHLGNAPAELVDELLTHCTNLKIVLTTREILPISGQKVLEVPLLTYPAIDSAMNDVPATGTYPALDLFVDRAQLVSKFELNAKNLQDVVSICRRLDGLPFAIVLAAGRTPEFEISEILAGLNQRFSLLKGGSITGLRHQQTLQTTVEWSYKLLPNLAQRLIQRLWVFKGGWDLEAAKAICIDNGITESDFLDLHMKLVRASFVERSPSQPNRYRLLETTRDYCHELLGKPERDRMRLRHFEYFLGVASGSTNASTLEKRQSFDRIASEYDNFRAALNRIRKMGKLTEQVKLTAALGRFWLLSGQFSEGRQFLEDALSHKSTVTTLEHAVMMAQVATIAYRQGDYSASRRYYNNALQVSDELGDLGIKVESLVGMGRLEREEGDLKSARTLLESAKTLAERSGYKQSLARALSNLAIVASDEGDFTAARKLLGDAEQLGKELADEMIQGIALNNLGVIERNAQNYDLALSLHQRSLTFMQAASRNMDVALDYYNIGIVLWHQREFSKANEYFILALDYGSRLGDKRAIALSLEGLGRVATWQKADAGRTARLFGAAETLRAKIKSPIEANEREDYLRAKETSRLLLKTYDFERAWMDGQAMSLEEAVRFAREGSKPA
jgi:predicted ATPase